MIPREEIRELVQLESPTGSAISFYFQPQRPQDKSHREESILIKDIVRECTRRAERMGNHHALREDLQKILQSAEHLHGNHSRGKVIFACREQGVWKERDVPPRLRRSQITVNSRFHLAPLVYAFSALPHACIALVDREKARIFELRGNDIHQHPDLYFGQLPHMGRSDGFRGYDAGHRERHLENEVMVHFKEFAESLQLLLAREHFDRLLIGCRDEAWPGIEPHLHPYLKQRLVGRFVMDPGTASSEEVREHATRLLEERRKSEEHELVREALGKAQRKSRGAAGLRHVLTALERQEVQILLIGDGLQAHAVECTNCRHLDTRMVKSCAVCGKETREVSDVSDALVELALRNDAEIRWVDGDPDLENAGRVGALLRYRADQNTPQKLAV